MLDALRADQSVGDFLNVFRFPHHNQHFQTVVVIEMATWSVERMFYGDHAANR